MLYSVDLLRHDKESTPDDSTIVRGIGALGLVEAKYWTGVEEFVSDMSIQLVESRVYMERNIFRAEELVSYLQDVDPAELDALTKLERIVIEYAEESVRLCPYEGGEYRLAVEILHVRKFAPQLIDNAVLNYGYAETDELRRRIHFLWDEILNSYYQLLEADGYRDALLRVLQFSGTIQWVTRNYDGSFMFGMD